MKSMNVIGLAVAALLVLTSLDAWSQASETPVLPGASAIAASGGAAITPGRKADRALRRKVYAAIGKHKEISAGDISVIAKDGAVTLNGSVTDASQIDQVRDIAQAVAGVASVTSKLTVKKPLGGM